MVCPSCGKENGQGMLQCEFCGAILPQPSQLTSQVPPDFLASTQPTGASQPQPVSVPQPPEQIFAPQPVPVVPPTQPMTDVMPPLPTTPPPPAAMYGSAAPVAVNNDGLPDGIKHWSWAGFLWGWLWAVFNHVWIGLLALIPVPGVALVMAIILGLNGREWAWKAKQWASVEDFNRVQRNWVKWWVILTVVGIIGAVVSGILIAMHH